MRDPVRNGVLEICRDHVAQFRHAIELMQAGKMGTGEMLGGQRVDTTAETIAWYSTLIGNLEETIAKIEADHA
jgi:hypothetical protein